MWVACPLESSARAAYMEINPYLSCLDGWTKRTLQKPIGDLGHQFSCSCPNFNILSKFERWSEEVSKNPPNFQNMFRYTTTQKLNTTFLKEGSSNPRFHPLWETLRITLMDEKGSMTHVTLGLGWGQILIPHRVWWIKCRFSIHRN